MTALEVSLSMAERGDATAARSLEAAIAGDALWDVYIPALLRITHTEVTYTMAGDRRYYELMAADIFNLRRATPAQIAEAYREATRT